VTLRAKVSRASATSCFDMSRAFPPEPPTRPDVPLLAATTQYLILSAANVFRQIAVFARFAAVLRRPDEPTRSAARHKKKSSVHVFRP
jgi:hypothetical protein